MRIIIDAMGGDNAPGEIVKGAVRARRELGVDITLVGREAEVRQCLAAENCDDIEVVNATEVITMEDDPSTATRRKKDASMTVALNLLRDGKGDAMVSAGSTGALLTGATLIVKRIRGIRRAALAPVLPAGEHGVLLIDCGANVECSSEYLLQFAYMGSFYAKTVMGAENPRVGLVNVGTEDTKGGAMQHETFALLKKAGEEGRINFVGNIEGSDVFGGKVEVAVCDGFTGNVLLKGCEGVIKFMMHALKDVFYKSTKNKLAALALKKDFTLMKDTLDVNKVGGTALLGISKPVCKAHGSSNAESLFATVRQAKHVVDSNIIGQIKENIDYMRIGSSGDAEA